MLAAVLVVAAGCAAGDGSPPPSAGMHATTSHARDGNFVLYVSNQSFETPRVDIRIEIDGKTAVDQHFDVGDQHNWVEYRFELPRGRHTLEAVSDTGEAEGSWRFTVSGDHWAVVDYWYYEGESKRFSFHLSDEPIGFA